MPQLLDTFACEGIASEGYQRAGFTTLGVDIDKARLAYYPGDTWPGDALVAIAVLGPGADAIHASPPCQAYTRGNSVRRAIQTKWPKLIPDVRAALQALDVPYVIENVKDAGPELVNPVTLCGCMFNLTAPDSDGATLHMTRPRLFETNFPLEAPRPCDHSNLGHIGGVYGGSRRAKRLPGETLAQVAPRDRYAAKHERKGGYVPRDKAVAAALIGTRRHHTWRGLQECIPPAYTEWIGHAIRAVL